ncbi:MAG: hypothetical protein LBK92_04310 [Endomicrobium sp.]|nr:hypothetical protein [Endomicrobium sp.]
MIKPMYEINLACGHYIDANVKGFRNKAAFNQLTRTTCPSFAKTLTLILPINKS